MGEVKGSPGDREGTSGRPGGQRSDAKSNGDLSERTSLPWLKFYPDRFLGSSRVRECHPWSQGIYALLLFHEHQQDGRGLPPADRLPRLLGLLQDEWDMVWPELRQFFVERGGRLFNDRLEAGLVHQRELYQSYAERGRKGGEATARSRRGEAELQAQLQAQPSRQLHEPEPEPEPEPHPEPEREREREPHTHPEPAPAHAGVCGEDAALASQPTKKRRPLSAAELAKALEDFKREAPKHGIRNPAGLIVTLARKGLRDPYQFGYDWFRHPDDDPEPEPESADEALARIRRQLEDANSPDLAGGAS